MGSDRRAVAYAVDLMFASRIQETLRREGYDIEVVETLDELAAALAGERPRIVLLDLHAGTEAREVVDLCRPVGVPVLAFGRHTEPALLRAAREAGCAEAVARSTFVEEMPQLVARVLAAGEGVAF